MILNINHGQLLMLLLVINLCQNIKSNSAAIGYMCVCDCVTVYLYDCVPGRLSSQYSAIFLTIQSFHDSNNSQFFYKPH